MNNSYQMPLSFSESPEPRGILPESLHSPAHQCQNSNEGLTDDDIGSPPAVPGVNHLLMPNNHLLDEVNMDVDSIYDAVKDVRPILPREAPSYGRHVNIDSYNSNVANWNDFSCSQQGSLYFPPSRVTCSNDQGFPSTVSYQGNIGDHDCCDDNNPNDNIADIYSHTDGAIMNLQEERECHINKLGGYGIQMSTQAVTDVDAKKVKINIPLGDDLLLWKITNSSPYPHQLSSGKCNPYLLTDSDMQKYIDIIQKVSYGNSFPAQRNATRKRRKEQRKKSKYATTTVCDADDSTDSISPMSSCSRSTDDNSDAGDDDDTTENTSHSESISQAKMKFDGKNFTSVKGNLIDEIDEGCSNSLTGITNAARPLWDPFRTTLDKRPGEVQDALLSSIYHASILGRRDAKERKETDTSPPLLLSWKDNDKRALCYIKGAKRFRCDPREDAESQKQAEEELIAALLKKTNERDTRDNSTSNTTRAEGRTCVKGVITSPQNLSKSVFGSSAGTLLVNDDKEDLLNDGKQGDTHLSRAFGEELKTEERKETPQEEDVFLSHALEELDIAASLSRPESSTISQKGKSLLMEQLLEVCTVKNQCNEENTGSVTLYDTDKIQMSPTVGPLSKKTLFLDGIQKNGNKSFGSQQGAFPPCLINKMCSSHDTFCLSNESLPNAGVQKSPNTHEGSNVLSPYCDRRRTEGCNGNILSSVRDSMKDREQFRSLQHVENPTHQHQFVNIVGLRKKPRFELDSDSLPVITDSGTETKTVLEDEHLPPLSPPATSNQLSCRVKYQRKRDRGDADSV